MPGPVNDLLARLPIQPFLIFPLILSCWIGWRDLKTGRIPNVLTLGIALSGMVFQLALAGWTGLSHGALGLLCGFGLLLLPYLFGGLGAGDVKALAALGAWLGPLLICYLFIYMTFCGAVIALGVICWQGKLWGRLLMIRTAMVNWVLCRAHGSQSGAAAGRMTRSAGIPFGVAMALGMLACLIIGV